MHIRHVSSSRTARRVLASAGIVGLALGAAACGSDDTDSGAPAPPAAAEKIGVALITKDSSNPFFVAMQKGAKADAAKQNVDLTVASGKQEGDDQGQITAIEDAIARGDKGILITPMSTGVNDADQEGARRGPLRHRPRHPARPGRHRRHHLRHRQPEAGQLDRQVGGVHARRQGRPPSPCSTCSTTRSSPSTTTVTRASSRAWASTSPTRRRTVTRPRPASTPAARAATTRSSATSRATAPRTAAARRWRTA